MESRRVPQLNRIGQRLLRKPSHLLARLDEGKNMSEHLFRGKFTYSFIYHAFSDLKRGKLIKINKVGRENRIVLTDKGKEIQRSLLIIMEKLKENG